MKIGYLVIHFGISIMHYEFHFTCVSANQTDKDIGIMHYQNLNNSIGESIYYESRKFTIYICEN